MLHQSRRHTELEASFGPERKNRKKGGRNEKKKKKNGRKRKVAGSHDLPAQLPGEGGGGAPARGATFLPSFPLSITSLITWPASLTGFETASGGCAPSLPPPFHLVPPLASQRSFPILPSSFPLSLSQLRDVW